MVSLNTVFSNPQNQCYQGTPCNQLNHQLVVCTFYFYTEGMNYGDISTSLTVHFSSGGHFHFHPGDFNLLPAEIHRQTRLYHSL